jgi:hypothetical protein
MFITKDIAVIVILLTVFFVILVRELKMRSKKEAEITESIEHTIIALLIRYGGKMNCKIMSRYFDASEGMIRAKIAEMEKKGIICQEGNDHNEIYLKHKPY